MEEDGPHQFQLTMLKFINLKLLRVKVESTVLSFSTMLGREILHSKDYRPKDIEILHFWSNKLNHKFTMTNYDYVSITSLFDIGGFY